MATAGRDCLGRRAHLRAQLDAFYFHKYGLAEEGTAYVLDLKAVYGDEFPARRSGC